MSTFTPLSMTLCYWVEYVSGITDATMMPVSRRFLSNQSHCSMSSIFLFFHTNSCLSFPYLNQHSFICVYSCTRIFASIFSYSQHIIKYSLSSTANREEKKEEKRREDIYEDVQCVHHHDSIFLLIFFPSLSLF